MREASLYRSTRGRSRSSTPARRAARGERPGTVRTARSSPRPTSRCASRSSAWAAACAARASPSRMSSSRRPTRQRARGEPAGRLRRQEPGRLAVQRHLASLPPGRHAAGQRQRRARLPLRLAGKPGAAAFLHPPHRKTKLVSYGTARYKIAAGKTATVKIKLSNAARKALRKKRKLPVTVSGGSAPAAWTLKLRERSSAGLAPPGRFGCESRSFVDRCSPRAPSYERPTKSCEPSRGPTSAPHSNRSRRGKHAECRACATQASPTDARAKRPRAPRAARRAAVPPRPPSGR